MRRYSGLADLTRDAKVEVEGEQERVVRKPQVFFYLNILIAIAAAIVLITSIVKANWPSAFVGAVFLLLATNALRPANRSPRPEQDRQVSDRTKTRPFSWLGAIFIAWALILLLVILSGVVVAAVDEAWGYSGMFLGFAVVWGAYTYWLVGRGFVRERPRNE